MTVRPKLTRYQVQDRLKKIKHRSTMIVHRKRDVDKASREFNRKQDGEYMKIKDDNRLHVDIYIHHISHKLYTIHLSLHSYRCIELPVPCATHVVLY